MGLTQHGGTPGKAGQSDGHRRFSFSQQACNGGQYLRISKETMVTLMQQRGCLSGEDMAGKDRVCARRG